MTPPRTITVAFTGASGLPYGVRLVECLLQAGCRVWLLYSQVAQIVARQEMDWSLPARPAEVEAELSARFTRLCEQLAADLERKGYLGKTIGLKLRFDNFTTVTRDQTLAAPTGDARVIRRAAGECARRVPLERRIRLLGVRASALSRRDAQPMAPDAQPIQAELFA